MTTESNGTHLNCRFTGFSILKIGTTSFFSIIPHNVLNITGFGVVSNKTSVFADAFKIN